MRITARILLYYNIIQRKIFLCMNNYYLLDILCLYFGLHPSGPTRYEYDHESLLQITKASCEGRRHTRMSSVITTNFEVRVLRYNYHDLQWGEAKTCWIHVVKKSGEYILKIDPKYIEDAGVRPLILTSGWSLSYIIISMYAGIH